MKIYLLIIGDTFALLITTLIGFATHGELDVSSLGRMSAAFFPLTLAWFLLAPWFGLFQQDIASDAKQLWRPILATVFAAPLAAVLRGLILNAPIIPIFGVVLAGTSAFGMLVWRWLYLFINGRNR
jgi:hypothetical protein